MSTNENFTKEYFKSFTSKAFSMLEKNEQLTLNMSAENTMFTRLSKAKIRQSTLVNQGFVSMSYQSDGKSLKFSFNYTQDESNDLMLVKKYLEKARGYKTGIDTDLYQVEWTNNGESIDEKISSNIPTNEEMISLALDHIGPYDLAGVLTSGFMIQANANSLGQFHWFKTNNFYLDYSFYNQKQKAVKGLFAGNVWNQDDYIFQIKDSINKLSMMEAESMEIKKGIYKVYLAPSAVNEILGMMSWGGVSFGDHKRGEGSFSKILSGEKKLSPKFSLVEDFSIGLSPRFNELGEEFAHSLTLIDKGEYKEFLTSTRTAKEFGVASNKASEGEGLRSPKILPGTLIKEDVLKVLGTGIYISDLHYLNLSDRETARITGMTRYACFWVENGEIKAPIKDLRFDESLYKILGTGLVDLTANLSIIPNLGSYDQRDIGGSAVPGILVDQFTFTL